MAEFRSLCVYCGSRNGGKPALEAAARDLGRLLADQGIRLVYGGGNIGLMGHVARTVLAGGGQVTGVIPEFLVDLEVGNPGVTELITVSDMHERKRRMFDMSDGFIALPGGLGTLDELVEILTWKQLQRHNKPVALLNLGGYWEPFRSLVDSFVQGGFAHAGVMDLFQIVDRVEDVLAALSASAAPDRDVLLSHLHKRAGA